MYKISFETVDDATNVDTAEIVCFKNDSDGDMEFKPIVLKNYHFSFYRMSNGGTLNAGEQMMELLQELAKVTRGGLSLIKHNDLLHHPEPISIINGRSVKSHIATVTNEGKILSINNNVMVMDEDMSDADSKLDFHTLLNDWVKNNPEIKERMKKEVQVMNDDGTITSRKPTMPEKMDVVGKELISQRMNDMITAQEFQDLFIQLGMFGMQDETLKTIYKLIY